MNIVVGTAGHIDHGKTALVKALTGVDADRLPEERRRGITIDLGFAEMDLGDVRVGFVDVPGHERFVKNMLAGAGGIDLVLLVVAADEGVMPQTREHFDICRLLETNTGIIVLTKSDLADDEMIELVRLDIADLVQNSFLETAPVLAVSSKTGAGLEELKRALREAARSLPPRTTEIATRLPIDRSFSMKGFGAVVTGTLSSGEIRESAEMELMPMGRRVRVRGVQTHGREVQFVHAGQRAAVNLGGIDYGEIERGMVLAETGHLRPTQILDAEIEVLSSAKRGLKTRQRVRAHIGTVEALARVQVLNDAGEIAPGEKDFVQLRLEIPVAAVPTEKFILRSYSPQTTIAGGKILDAHALKHRRRDLTRTREFLKHLSQAQTPSQTLRLRLEAAEVSGLTFSDLLARTGWTDARLRETLTETTGARSVVELDGFYIARAPFEKLKSDTLEEINAHHRREPLTRGMLRETLRDKLFSRIAPQVFRGILSALEADEKILSAGDVVRAGSHIAALSTDEKTAHDRIHKMYQDAGLEVPALDTALSESIAGTRLNRDSARKIFQLFLDAGTIVKVTEDFYFPKIAIDKLIAEMRQFAASSPDRLIDVAAFKTIARVSRKYAIPLLEYFDSQKITRRAGDKRRIL
jgi:selenocysteine-specific elongation factor